MKVIDLLNRIANGEEVPEKIKFEYLEYELLPERNNYYCSEHMRWFTNEINALGVLNNEVEIIEEEPRNIEVCGSLFTRSEYNRLAGIEEDKKIKKLEHWVDVKSWVEGNDLEKGLEEQGEFNKNIYYKINEIIDRINSMEDK